LAPTALSFDARLDDRGAPPDENQAIDDEDMNEDNADEVEMINPDPLPPSNDGTSDASGARWRATFDAATSTLITIFSASSCATSPTSTVTNTSIINVHIDSRTNTLHNKTYNKRSITDMALCRLHQRDDDVLELRSLQETGVRGLNNRRTFR